MPFTLENIGDGTIAIFCPGCSALLNTPIDLFLKDMDYRLGIRCGVCNTQFIVALVPGAGRPAGDVLSRCGLVCEKHKILYGRCRECSAPTATGSQGSDLDEVIAMYVSEFGSDGRAEQAKTELEELLQEKLSIHGLKRIQELEILAKCRFWFR